MENKADDIILLQSLLKKFYDGEITLEDNAELYRIIKSCNCNKLSPELIRDIHCYLVIYDLTNAKCAESFLEEIEKEIESETKLIPLVKTSIFKKFRYKFSSAAAIISIMIGLSLLIIFKVKEKNTESESPSLVTQYPYDIMPDYDDFIEEGYTVIEDPTIAAYYINDVNNTLKANLNKGFTAQSSFFTISRKFFSSTSM